MSYRVRRAAPADALELVRFVAGAGSDAEASRRLARALGHDATLRCWVVEWGYDIVGTMCVVARAGGGKLHWLIESIDLEPAHRGRGLTRMLLDAVRADAQVHKVRSPATQCSPRGRGAGDCLLTGRLY